MNRKEIVALAFAYVYPNVDELIKAQAREHTIANMGFSVEQMLERFSLTGLEKTPDRVIDLAWSGLMGDMESDEMADGVNDEYRAWLKDAKRDALLVQKAGLPLTLDNTRQAFEKTGQFAKKKSNKK
jgi:hypothetical protein